MSDAAHLAHAHERRDAARELCRRARARLQATQRCVVESRALLDGRGRSSLGSAHHGTVVQIPVTHDDPSEPRDELAPLIDFVARRGAHGDDSPTNGPAHVESLLGQILWDFGAEHARPLVEAVLALLDASERAAAGTIQPEIDALRRWLERHPG